MATLPADPNLSVLFGAVSSRTSVELRYRDRERRIDPYRLEFQRGRWYLSGLDHTHGEERNFRLDRIEGPVALARRRRRSTRPSRARRPGGPGGPGRSGGDDVVAARVRIDAPQARWAVQHVGPDHVVAEEDDGSVVVELPVTNRDAFRSFVLSFLDHAEVLDPPELRADMVAWLTELAAR